MPQFTDQPNIGPINHCYVSGQETDRSLRCRHEGNCLTAYGKTAFEAFLDANPGIKFTEETNPCFGIIAKGSIRAHTPCDGYGNRLVGSKLIDHEAAARIQPEHAVYIPQPYYTANYPDFNGQKAAEDLIKRIAQSKCMRKRLSGMTLLVRYAGSARSWYNPGNSALWLIGTPEAVATINTEYAAPPLPDELTIRQKETIQADPEKFDAPTPCPTWTIEIL